jgi:aerobic-type carbon monoxide dehydrogenase small subunit (CoxS/CutS family)
MPATKLNINGRDVTVEAEASRMLLWVLREDLDLTGAKYGCGEGQCGACTVLADGVAIRSCVTPVRTIAGRKIVTVEGLEQNGRLTLVQQAFLDKNAFQCGYCTPGMVMAATGLLQKNPHPTEGQIKESMNGNICRCGTYPRIVAAVRLASRGTK